MKIITYSDLHLEFGSGWSLPDHLQGDLMILAGDIIKLNDYAPLHQLLRKWNKPVLYVAGNHEYYTQTPMNREQEKFKAWLAAHHPLVNLLLDEAALIDGVNFFGGTMWTDFNNGDQHAMQTARSQINDFRLIQNPDGTLFRPLDAIALHMNFVAKLLAWFAQDLAGPRVVITHNAPVVNPHTKFNDSPLMPAFNSLDMMEVIQDHQPALWVYGHTHECDDQTIGRTRVISNQLGYPAGHGSFECREFDPSGRPIDL